MNSQIRLGTIALLRTKLPSSVGTKKAGKLRMFKLSFPLENCSWQCFKICIDPYIILAWNVTIFFMHKFWWKFYRINCSVHIWVLIINVVATFLLHCIKHEKIHFFYVFYVKFKKYTYYIQTLLYFIGLGYNTVILSCYSINYHYFR